MSFQGIRAVIFDKDGVLIDTEGEYDRRRRIFFAENGIDDTAFPDFYGSNNAVIWGCVEPGDPARREELYQAFLARFADEPMRYSRFLVPGVADTLRALKEKGLLLGLASSSPHWCIDNFLAECGLTGVFDVVLSGEEVGAPKPAPDVYLSVMDALAVKPSQVLVVEDSSIGLRAAHDSGARVCSILPPSAPDLDQSLADVHVDRFGDVLNLV